MKIVIANDHRGVELKNKLLPFLKEEGYSVYNVGTDTSDSVDYPIYAKELSKHLEMNDLGILICGTGIGMSIAANKIKGIRCAKANTIDEAKMTRADNAANVLALSSEMEVSEVKKIVNVFLKTGISMDERHVRRRKMLEALEDER